MKEFDYVFEDIFGGLVAEREKKKNSVSLLECHNIEPTKNDYRLHEFVVDMDTDSYDWGNA